MHYLALVVLLAMPVAVRQAEAADREQAVQRQFTPIRSSQPPLAPPQAGAQSKPPLRLAPRSEAARQVVARPKATTPGRAIGTVAGSLGIVLGLFFVVSWCLARAGGKRSDRLPKEALEVLGQAPLAGRQQVQLVRLGNKLLLLAHSPAAVETLAEVSEPTEVEALVAMCRRAQAGSATVSFREALTELSRERGRESIAEAVIPNGERMPAMDSRPRGGVR